MMGKFYIQDLEIGLGVPVALPRPPWLFAPLEAFGRTPSIAINCLAGTLRRYTKGLISEGPGSAH